MGMWSLAVGAKAWKASRRRCENRPLLGRGMGSFSSEARELVPCGRGKGMGIFSSEVREGFFVGGAKAWLVVLRTCGRCRARIVVVVAIHLHMKEARTENTQKMADSVV